MVLLRTCSSSLRGSIKMREYLQLMPSRFSLLRPTGPFYIYTINYFNLKDIQFPTIQNSQSNTTVKKWSDQWPNLHRNLRAGEVPSTGDRVGGVPTLPALHSALTKYLTRDTPGPQGSGGSSLPPSRGGRPRPMQYPSPLPSPTTRSSGRRTICPSTRHKLHHETKRPPVEAGARPPSVTAAPITLLRPNQRRGKQPPRPQACTSFPPLPHAALARTNSPRGRSPRAAAYYPSSQAGTVQGASCSKRPPPSSSEIRAPK